MLRASARAAARRPLLRRAALALSSRPTYRLREEQLALQETARQFARNELVELAAELERDNKPVPDDMRRRCASPNVACCSRRLLTRLSCALCSYAEMGFLGINTPEEYGGLGMGHLDALIVLEEFGKVSSAVAFPIFECLVGPIKAVQRFGSDEMRSRLLPPVTAGDFVVACARRSSSPPRPAPASASPHAGVFAGWRCLSRTPAPPRRT